MHETSLFKALSDPIRLRLASLLSISGEKCVCMLAQALGEPDFKISRHLGIMRSVGMVESRREGTWIYYRLAEPRSAVEACLQQCMRDHMNKDETIKNDLERLSAATCSIEPGHTRRSSSVKADKKKVKTDD